MGGCESGFVEALPAEDVAALGDDWADGVFGAFEASECSLFGLE